MKWLAWLCWFRPHNFAPTTDKYYKQCSRCDKVIEVPPLVPRGASLCPYYPLCEGWSAAPPHRVYKTNDEGTAQQTLATMKSDTHCTFCKRPIRWERRDPNHEWPAPNARDPNFKD